MIDGFDKALYGNDQFIRIHRFYSACLEARLERTHTVFSGAIGRQRNGRDVSAFFSRQRAYFSHERITVFLRHYDISDQNIKTLATNERGYDIAIGRLRESGELAVPIMIDYLRNRARSGHLPGTVALGTFAL